MSISISRRSFVKCAAAASMSVALTGLLSGCGDNDEKPEEGGTGNGEGTEEPETPEEPTPEPTPITYTVAAVPSTLTFADGRNIFIDSDTLEETDTAAALNFSLTGEVYMNPSNGADYAQDTKTRLLNPDFNTGAAFTLFHYTQLPGSFQNNILAITVGDPATASDLGSTSYKAIDFSVKNIEEKCRSAISEIVRNELKTLGFSETLQDTIAVFANTLTKTALDNIFKDKNSPDFSLSSTLRGVNALTLSIKKGGITSGWGPIPAVPSKDIFIEYGKPLFATVIETLVNESIGGTIQFTCVQNPTT